MNQAKLMMMTAMVKKILDAVMDLPDEDREDLVEALNTSLDRSPGGALSPAWEAEIERRNRKIDLGTATLVPAEEVYASIEARLGVHR